MRNDKLQNMCWKIKVVKASGKTEEFLPEKIVLSIYRTGASSAVARKIAAIVTGKVLESGKNKVETKEIARIILRYLKKENEQWYKNWIIFTRKAKAKRKEAEKKLQAELKEYIKK
jgi:transcriptional regulator NrdR family protein